MPDDGAAAARRPAGALEAEVLALLRAAGAPLSPGQVQDRLAAARSSPLSLQRPVLQRSVLQHGGDHPVPAARQGPASRQRDGRAFAYTVVDEASLAASRMSQALDTGDDHDAVLTRFVSGLSGRDARLLRRLLGPDSAGGPDPGHGAADHGAADHGAADHGAAAEHGAADHGPGRDRA